MIVYDHTADLPVAVKRPDGKRASLPCQVLTADGWDGSLHPDNLPAKGIYADGGADPIPEGHRVVSESREVVGDVSRLVRVTEEIPVDLPALQKAAIRASKIECRHRIYEQVDDDVRTDEEAEKGAMAKGNGILAGMYGADLLAHYKDWGNDNVIAHNVYQAAVSAATSKAEVDAAVAPWPVWEDPVP